MVQHLTRFKEKAFLFYMLKCLLGAGICYSLFILFPSMPFYWSIVSVLLVLAPADEEAMRFALDRMKANIIGATIGLLVFVLFSVSFISMMIGILLTIAVCTLINSGPAVRTALAALVIVLVQEGEQNNWLSAFSRMFCVCLGCFVAISLISLFKFIRNHKF